MKKLITISTVVVTLFAFSGISTAADYRITWINNLGENSSCYSVQAQAYFASSKVAEVKLPQALTNRSQTMTLSAVGCTTIKLSASCSYPSPSTDPNRVGMAEINPTLEVACSNGTATVTKERNALKGGWITFRAL